MFRNMSLGTRVRVCIYYTKAKCRQGYCVVVMFISRFSDCCYFFSYTGCPYLLIHVVSLGTEKEQVNSVAVAMTYHH